MCHRVDPPSPDRSVVGSAESWKFFSLGERERPERYIDVPIRTT